MKVSLSARSPLSASAEVLVVVASSSRPDDTLEGLDSRSGGMVRRTLERRRFRPPAGSPILVQLPPARNAAEYLGVVPGDAADANTWRTAADFAVSKCRELRAGSAAVVVPGSSQARLVAETAALAAYSFNQLKSKPADNGAPKTFDILAPADRSSRAAVARGLLAARGANLARDLINLPADICTPRFLAATARQIARKHRLRVRILEPAAMRRLGMGALLGVARGSSEPARFIELIYRPPRPRRAVAVVGKGITFDSGGLSLKNPESMQTQKRDMSGGAVVLGLMSVIRELGAAVEVRGYVAATENLPSGTAIKPGDVVRALNGTTIEVLNTDAEGRLVLADALAYAARRRPDVMIDFATLTAAVRAALGIRYAAIMANDGSLARQLIDSAAAAGELLWELPLVQDYRRDIDSSVADIKNMGEGHAGTIIGGLFLREFTAGIPWAHIDFSSTAVAEKPFPGHGRGASGFGVRTMLNYIEAVAGAARRGVIRDT